MISRYTHQDLTWIDLESPTKEEVSALAEEFDLHPIVAGEIMYPSERAKIDFYSGAIYLVLHFPIRNRTTGLLQEAEVDFILLDKVLITTHYELVDPLHDFGRMFETGTHFTVRGGPMHAGVLFFSALRELYKHTLFILESLSRDIREEEKHIFSGKEDMMVVRISKTNRELIDMRQALRFHKESLKSLRGAAIKMYGEEFGFYIDAIEGEFERLGQTLKENRYTLSDLRETNDSLLSSKTADTIRRLTAINVILMPLSLITWIFAMDSKYLSLDDPRMLLTVFGAMGSIFLVSVLFFRSKKWL